MNRRRFCKIGALALGAVGLGVSKAHGGIVGDRMENRPLRAFRVTAIRKECYEDIQSLYLDDPEAGPCDVFVAGTVMEFAPDAVCPDGFCRMAWNTIVGCVNSSRACVEMRENVRVVACPDGARPVIFKVELL